MRWWTRCFGPVWPCCPAVVPEFVMCSAGVALVVRPQTGVMGLVMLGERVVPQSPSRVPGWLVVALAPLVVGVVAAGVWVTGGLLTDNEVLAKGATVAWFALAGGGAVATALRWRRLAVPVLGGDPPTVTLLGGDLVGASPPDPVGNQGPVGPA